MEERKITFQIYLRNRLNDYYEKVKLEKNCVWNSHVLYYYIILYNLDVIEHFFLKKMLISVGIKLHKLGSMFLQHKSYSYWYCMLFLHYCGIDYWALINSHFLFFLDTKIDCISQTPLQLGGATGLTFGQWLMQTISGTDP